MIYIFNAQMTDVKISQSKTLNLIHSMIYIFNAQMKYNFRKNLRDMFLEWKSMNEWCEIV